MTFFAADAAAASIPISNMDGTERERKKEKVQFAIECRETLNKFPFQLSIAKGFEIFHLVFNYESFISIVLLLF